MIVEMLVPMIQKEIQEEMVHEPSIIQQERIIQQDVEIVVEVPIPMMQEAPPPALAVEPLMDQSSRYTDLSLDQKSPHMNGKHALVTHTCTSTCLPRLAMIGMFFQADPAGSLWVEGALYTASLQRAEGFWDP
eukprot:16437416-Heterocapsa_arctica.AAC.1